MNQEDFKGKLDDAKDSAQSALSGIQARIKGMDKEKVKDAMSGAKEKANGVLAEIKANFKPDEGAEGVKKYKSMFVNLWKSGTTGKVAIVVFFVVVMGLLNLIIGGDDEGGRSQEQIGSRDGGYNVQRKSTDDEVDAFLKDLKDVHDGVKEIGRAFDKVSERDVEKAFEDFGREVEREARRFEREFDKEAKQLELELNSL